jgi:hypothetical protein
LALRPLALGLGNTSLLSASAACPTVLPRIPAPAAPPFPSATTSCTSVATTPSCLASALRADSFAVIRANACAATHSCRRSVDAATRDVRGPAAPSFASRSWMLVVIARKNRAS